MQKLCTHCETLYTPKQNNRGSEQVYCSIKCRTSAAQQRMINKIKEIYPQSILNIYNKA